MVLALSLSLCLIGLVLIFVFDAMIVRLLRRNHSKSFIQKTNQKRSFFQKSTKFYYWNMGKNTWDRIFLRCFIVYRLLLINLLLASFVTAILSLVIDYQERYMFYYLWGLGAEFFAIILLTVYGLIYQNNGVRKWISKKDKTIYPFLFLTLIVIVIICILC